MFVISVAWLPTLHISLMEAKLKERKEGGSLSFYEFLGEHKRGETKTSPVIEWRMKAMCGGLRQAGGAASLWTSFGLSCPLNGPQPVSLNQVVPVVALLPLIMRQHPQGQMTNTLNSNALIQLHRQSCSWIIQEWTKTCGTETTKHPTTSNSFPNGTVVDERLQFVLSHKVTWSFWLSVVGCSGLCATGLLFMDYILSCSCVCFVRTVVPPAVLKHQLSANVHHITYE